MTQPQRFRTIAALALAGILLSPGLLRAQGDPPLRGVERTVFEVAPHLLNNREVLAVLEEMYPTELREAAISGSVILWLFVDDTGTVADASLHRSSGYDEFDAAALVVAEAMEFRPGLTDGEPVSGWILQRIDFNTR